MQYRGSTRPQSDGPVSGRAEFLLPAVLRSALRGDYRLPRIVSAVAAVAEVGERVAGDYGMESEGDDETG
jgi:hypothetical protein